MISLIQITEKSKVQCKNIETIQNVTYPDSISRILHFTFNGMQVIIME